MSKAGQMTIGLETALTPKAVAAKADFSYAIGDIGAAHRLGQLPRPGA